MPKVSVCLPPRCCFEKNYLVAAVFRPKRQAVVDSPKARTRESERERARKESLHNSSPQESRTVEKHSRRPQDRTSLGRSEAPPQFSWVSLAHEFFCRTQPPVAKREGRPVEQPLRTLPAVRKGGGPQHIQNKGSTHSPIASKNTNADLSL